MSNFQLFIPADAPRGGSIAAEDFGAAADELLSKALEGDVISDELGKQARAVVNAAKRLVAAGEAGSQRVVGVISTRVNPDAIPAGTGHIVSIELSSRPSPQVEAAPEVEQAAAPSEPQTADDAAEVAATQAALDHANALGIDIATIQGTGKDGKVTKADVEAAEAAKANPTS